MPFWTGQFMADRDAQIATFLSNTDWGMAKRSVLADDASFRRYDRLTTPDNSAVLMDAPPPAEDVRPFVRIARHLTSLGLNAPEILAEDEQHGFLLLEDFGDETFTQVLKTTPEREAELYASAIDVLIDLHKKPEAKVRACPLMPYDTNRLIEEARLLIDWYLPAITGEDVSPKLLKEYCDLWRNVFTLLEDQPRTLVLRDYHVDNLVWLDHVAGNSRTGLLDFQDALFGPTVYDVVSLLEDARRDIAPSLINGMLDRYTQAFSDLAASGPARDAFNRAYAITGAGRHAKVIGIFTRLCVRDAKPGYLVHIPRVWKLLEQSLRHPALAPVRDWIDDHIPETKRGIPLNPAATQK